MWVRGIAFGRYRKRLELIDGWIAFKMHSRIETVVSVGRCLDDTRLFRSVFTGVVCGRHGVLAR